jgi:hypothetical protein
VSYLFFFFHFFLSITITKHFYSPVVEQEPKRGMVQLFYESFAGLRKKTGEPVFVFWDYNCLNFGQNWEQGFLNALVNSRAIVLLISMKVYACELLS